MTDSALDLYIFCDTVLGNIITTHVSCNDNDVYSIEDISLEWSLNL